MPPYIEIIKYTVFNAKNTPSDIVNRAVLTKFSQCEKIREQPGII
jgi:hypothetical protein